MNALKDLTSLSSAAVLQELFFSTRNGLAPEEYEWIANLANIKRATIALGSVKRNNRFKELAEGYGVEQFRFEPFEYV